MGLYSLFEGFGFQPSTKSMQKFYHYIPKPTNCLKTQKKKIFFLFKVNMWNILFSSFGVLKQTVVTPKLCRMVYKNEKPPGSIELSSAKKRLPSGQFVEGLEFTVGFRA